MHFRLNIHLKPNMTNKAPAPFSEDAVAAIIEERIKNGSYVPGSRVPSERALSEEFGVSRRFARMAYVKLIDQGLLEKSHYRRPFVAFAGKMPLQDYSRQTPPTAPAKAAQTIAVVLPSDPVFPNGLSIVSGIHKVLTETESTHRLTFLDTFHAARPEVLRREAQAINSALENGVGGLIWWHYGSEEWVQEIVQQCPGLPIVFIDRYPNGLHCNFVGIDDMESARNAVDYLLDLGHTRIAHLMDPGHYSTILERAQGYRAALRARGLPVNDAQIVHLGWEQDRMQQAFDRLFSQPAPPTALFATHDYIAQEFIHIAEANGIRVPDDLSVLGHGNIDRSAARGFLSSVEQDFEMIGRAAARMMLTRLASGPTSPRSYQQVILPAPLVLRTSCQKPAP